MYICRHCSPLLCFILFPKIKHIVPREWNLKWQLSAWLTPSQSVEPKEVTRVNLSLFCPLLTLGFESPEQQHSQGVSGWAANAPHSHKWCTSFANTCVLWLYASVARWNASPQIVPFVRNGRAHLLSSALSVVKCGLKITSLGLSQHQLQRGLILIMWFFMCPLTWEASQRRKADTNAMLSWRAGFKTQDSLDNSSGVLIYRFFLSRKGGNFFQENFVGKIQVYDRVSGIELSWSDLIQQTLITPCGVVSIPRYLCKIIYLFFTWPFQCFKLAGIY